MANDDPNDPILIAPLRRAEDGKLGFIANPQEAFMASPPKQRTRLIGYREGKTDHGIHATEAVVPDSMDKLKTWLVTEDRDVAAVLAHMESELLNLPDYATARFKALLAELKAKL